MATHVREAGVDVRTLQLLLGHREISTTTRYLPISRRHLSQVKSPFDLLHFDAIDLTPMDSCHAGPSRLWTAIAVRVASPDRLGSGGCLPPLRPRLPASLGHQRHARAGHTTDLIACRTAQLGGHAEPCPTCRFERFAYHSCRNRHGPKCHTLAPVKWLQARQAELLPVPSVHAVFTLPQALNGLIQAHPRQLLSLLFQSVGQTLKQVGRHQRGGQLGATLILPTWDPTWGAHVHLHGLIPAGVLDEPGDSWVPRHPHFRLSVHALSEVVRGQFVEALNPAHDQRQLEVGTTAGSRSDREDLASLLDRLYAHQGGVYSKAPFAKPQQVLDDLGRYTHRVAMSNHRLVEVAEGQVRLTWRNRRQGGRQDTLTLEAVELIRRFLWPILPRGLVRIRHVGCLANRAKARALKRCRHVLGLPTEVPHPTLPSVAEWMVQVKGIEIERCPSGGHRPLQRFPLAPLPAAQGSQTMPSILDSS